MRILLMAAAWLAFSVITFYACIKPECCTPQSTSPDQSSAATPPATASSSAFSVVTTLNSPEVTTGSEWPTVRDGLLSRYSSDTSRVLQVVGNYYADEATPSNDENMGEARANRIASLFADQIPEGNIKIRSRLLSDDPPPPSRQWLAASFDFLGGDAGAEAEVIRLSEREYKIRFPFNSGTGDLSPPVVQYLASLARQLSDSSDRVTIVGHTDDVGSSEANRELGLRRAEFVKKYLVAAGAPAAKIVVSSRGESEPEYANDSEGNRYNNRRVVITLVDG